MVIFLGCIDALLYIFLFACNCSSNINMYIFLASREASPSRLDSSLGTSPPTSVDDSDHSDDEYIDSIEVRYFDTIDVSFSSLLFFSFEYNVLLYITIGIFEYNFENNLPNKSIFWLSF